MNSHITDPTHEVFLYQNCDKLPASAIRRKAFDPWATSQDAADFPHDPPITAKGISLKQSVPLKWAGRCRNSRV